MSSDDPHRYWHLLIIGNSSNVSSISRLEFRETEGGADIAPGHTIISTGSWTGVADLFDGNDSTFGFTNGAAARNAPFSVGIDFGASSGGWPVLREIAIRNRSPGSGGEFQQGPTNMVVRYSDDNITFHPAWQMSAEPWGAFSTVRTYAKDDYPYGRLVFDVVTPPTDSGPHATVLTASGGATTSGGRFIFPDGNGDYYSNTAVSAEISTLPWEASVEIDAVLATANGFNGVLNIGDGSNRLIVTENNGVIQVFGLAATITATTTLSSVTPTDIRLELDGTDIDLLINGVVEASGTFNVGVLPNDLYLGTDPADINNRSMLGSFAGVRIMHGLVSPPPPPSPAQEMQGGVLVVERTVPPARLTQGFAYVVEQLVGDPVARLMQGAALSVEELGGTLTVHCTQGLAYVVERLLDDPEDEIEWQDRAWRAERAGRRIARFVDMYAPAGMGDYPCVASPRWSDRVIGSDSGDMLVEPRWTEPLYRFSLPEAVTDQETLEAIRDHWLIMRGPAHTWPFRNPLDFASCALTEDRQAPITPLDQVLGGGNGIKTRFQLLKRYTRGGQHFDRVIRLPLPESVVVSVGGVQIGRQYWSVSRRGGVINFDTPPGVGQIVRAGFLFDHEVRFEGDDALDAMQKSFAASGHGALTLIETRETSRG